MRSVYNPLKIISVETFETPSLSEKVIISLSKHNHKFCSDP